MLGLSFASGINGGAYKDAQVAALTPATSAETVLELTYKFQATPWLALQPDLQYIMHPGTVQGVKNAVVAITRFEVTF